MSQLNSATFSNLCIMPFLQPLGEACVYRDSGRARKSQWQQPKMAASMTVECQVARNLSNGRLCTCSLSLYLSSCSVCMLCVLHESAFVYVLPLVLESFTCVRALVVSKPYSHAPSLAPPAASVLSLPLPPLAFILPLLPCLFCWTLV